MRLRVGGVARVEEAEDELREAVQFLKDPADQGRVGAHELTGILHVGPAGIGKLQSAREELLGLSELKPIAAPTPRGGQSENCRSVNQ